TLAEIETAAIAGLRGLIDVEIAYMARREHGVWTIGTEVGLEGDVAGVSAPEELVPYAEALRAGETICYESPSDMGFVLSEMLGAIGLRSLYAVPLMRGGSCIGALAIGRHVASHFSVRDRALVRLFTAHLSVLFAKRDLVASLETLAEAVPAIVLRTDPSGWIYWYNQRWYEFTGQTAEEAVGWGWQTAHHPVDFQRVIEEWPRALATGVPIEIEFRLRRFDGVYQWHFARVDPVRDENGGIIGWCGNLVNIDVQRQTLERTKRVADSLQEAFLPQRLPSRDWLRLDASYVSAETDALVGGDWYDAFDLPGGKIGFSIGDVAGHGLAASMQVAKLRQSIYVLALRMDDPAAILSEVNRMLVLQEPGLFVTSLVGYIDSDGTNLHYATAGHPPPLVAYRADRSARALPTGGLPLGVADDVGLSTHTIPIVRDMVFALYTDGLTEFAHDAIAAETKLRSVLPKLVGNAEIDSPACTVYQSVLGGCAPRDDTAIMVMQFSQFPKRAVAPAAVQPPAKQWRFHAASAQAAHVMRQEIAAYLEQPAGGSEDASNCELIVGELLANTVEHAPGLVELAIEWTHEHAILTVSDNGAGVKSLRNELPADILHEGSRGLFLVHALSLGVTVDTSPTGGARIRVVLPIASMPRDAAAETEHVWDARLAARR
ncbi:MAG: SpoIIE family protein phosphatase, partial [Candidatus Eremiobacteraeota bacterium]|nr:SpoIIE family protein phosphatase [Candidatus Eremiobacteraeota bacterium]